MAAESLAGHIGQRIRWARGMIQIFRMDNPLFGKGLKLSQRLCYFSAMLHFLSGVPRLIFFVAPSAFLLFNASIVYATGWMLLLYLTPHIVHAVLANDRIQGKYRRFLWNEIYESVMAWYIAIPTTIALINPHKGTFNVTAKGDLIKERYVNWGIARPYVVLLIINFIGLISACLHLIIGPLTLNPYGDVLPYFITMVWLFYNMIILGGALGVSIETRQVRKAHRVTFTMPAVLRRQNGQEISCTIRDYSYTGLGMDLDEPEVFQNEEAVDLLIKHNERDYAFPCTVAYIRNQKMGVYLNALSLQENIDFIQCTFARSEVWVLWQGGFEQDKPLQSMKEVFTLDLRGYWDIIEFTSPAVRKFLIGFARVIIWIGSFIPRRPKYCLING
jgi:cellulose synthase (UDP-forming)